MKRITANENQVSKRQREAIIILVGGMIGMVISMGIGRFSYTPMIPIMQRDLEMSYRLAGWLAGVNYLGYLIGAIVYSFLPYKPRTRHVVIFSFVLIIFTTAAMGCFVSALWWGSMRFISGVASAVIFVIISADVGEALVDRGYGHWIGFVFTGVGGGIVLSGLVVPLLDRGGVWDDVWMGMGLISLLLFLLWCAITAGEKSVPESRAVSSVQFSSTGHLWPLVTAYFFEGLGYVVTATFLVAIVSRTEGLESFGGYSWVVVGFSAMMSTLLWPLLARFSGRKRALLLAYIIQAGGVLVSIRADTIIEVMFVAVAFGSTFMGITALILTEGHFRMPQNKGRVSAVLTASFGTGQILGPVGVGYLADLQGDFALSLLLAASGIIIGCVFVGFDHLYVQANQRKRCQHAIRKL